MIFGIGLSLVFSILLCVHVVRSGREMYWLFIILAFPGLGGLVYFIVNVLPDLTGGSHARKLEQSARKALNPEGEYRDARARVEDSPTVANRMRLAAAAADLGRHDEAERMYAEAATGIHADDATLLLGRARALVELNRAAEALPILDRLGELGEAGRTPQAALIMGRAYEAMGRMTEADTAYQWAAGRLPGLEGWPDTPPSWPAPAGPTKPARLWARSRSGRPRPRPTSARKPAPGAISPPRPSAAPDRVASPRNSC